MCDCAGRGGGGEKKYRAETSCCSKAAAELILLKSPQLDLDMLFYEPGSEFRCSECPTPTPTPFKKKIKKNPEHQKELLFSQWALKSWIQRKATIFYWWRTVWTNHKGDVKKAKRWKKGEGLSFKTRSGLCNRLLKDFFGLCSFRVQSIHDWHFRNNSNRCTVTGFFSSFLLLFFNKQALLLLVKTKYITSSFIGTSTLITEDIQNWQLIYSIYRFLFSIRLISLTTPLLWLKCKSWSECFFV